MGNGRLVATSTLEVCLIDKLEVRVPAKAPYSREFQSLYTDVRGDVKNDPFRPSQHYVAVGDLRKFGYDSILHAHCKHGKEANHKLELMETGGMTYSGMIREIERVFDVNAQKLDITRVDLCTDIPNVPVQWFYERTRVLYKQWRCAMGEFSQMGSRKIETLYFGKRPNCFRVYDKHSEYHNQYQKFIRKVSEDQEVPSFEQVYGLPESDYVLTRVERQIGGGRLPLKISSVGRLKNATEFNPFEPVKFIAGGKAEPHPSNYQFLKWCAGMYLREQFKSQGAQNVRNFVVANVGKTHAKRFLDQFNDFLPIQDLELNPEALYLRYRDSVERQLAA